MKTRQHTSAPHGCGSHTLMLLLGAAMLCATARAAQKGDANPGVHRAMPQASSSVADPAACAACHKEIVKNSAGNPHDKPAPIDGGNGVNCASCHGSGEAHAHNGGLTLIFDFAKATPKEVDAKCQTCHGGKHADFERTAHAAGNVSCLSCHTIHAPAVAKHLLKMAQPQLCYQCHGDIQPQFSQPSRHKVEEGLVECTDCHDAHGALPQNARSSAQGQFMVCTKCHAAVAGPFVYEHAAVKAEGCTACHFAHGGPNPHLLTQPGVNTICLECHFPPPDSAAGLPAVPEHIQSAHQESCVACHASIHGSNTSAVFLNLKQDSLVLRSCGKSSRTCSFPNQAGTRETSR